MADCTAAVASAPQLNAPMLFDGAVLCARDGRHEDTNFLIILGQVRAVPDMSVLEPDGDEEMKKAAALYGRIYYEFGGLGFDEIYRRPETTAALEQRIRSADLRYVEGYDPGWAYKTSKLATYAAAVAEIREHRLWQMNVYALKIQNDEYYEAHKAFEDLKRKTGAFEVGTPAYEESIRLQARMDEIARSIPEPPPPGSRAP